MALVKSKLEKDLEKMLTDLSKSEDKEKSIKQFASKLATIIDAYIKTAKVTVDIGIAVTTTGGNGSTTSLGNGSLS